MKKNWKVSIFFMHSWSISLCFSFEVRVDVWSDCVRSVMGGYESMQAFPFWIHSPCLPGWLEWEGKKRWERKDPWSQGVGKANYALREAEGDKWKSSINAGCHYQSICSGWCIKSPTNLCVAGGRCTPTMAGGLTYEEWSLKRDS